MLAVTGGKGGVGKTTTALGVAEALARAEGGAVVVDADREMPDLARLAGCTPADPAATPSRGVEALAAGVPLDRAGRSPPDCAGVTVVSTGRCSDATLRRALARVARADVPVVVDCPAGAGTGTAVPLACARTALVVSTPTPAALRDAAKSAAMARALDTPPLGSALTRCRTPPAGVDRLLGCPVRARIPPATSPRENDAVRAAYRRLAERFTSHLP
ncbi:MinD/ParA family ATP-binding protein [Halomarina ordinaria]|uniref:MinD/ParA family protein n=1 Tax=Halomarina ordinaria TaxID=3033939 RepID=A0ABD5U529_9EURY|nr:P-loop NTPase [Halomarina sp. PSRA2]